MGSQRGLILVVDDDADVRGSTALALGLGGYDVLGAADGQEALDGLRRGPRPDLILLDLEMPGMDGWGFRREQLRDPALASIPVVLCSAVWDLPQHARTLQAVAWLKKPFSIDRLLDTVEKLCALAQPAPAGSRLILVVDDDCGLLESVRETLDEEGYKVQVAADGQEALAELRRTAERPDLILLDWRMPRMTGPEFCDARRRDPQLAAIPVVAFSAASIGGDEMKRFELAGWIAKPVGLKDLLTQVERYCGAHAA